MRLKSALLQAMSIILAMSLCACSLFSGAETDTKTHWDSEFTDAIVKECRDNGAEKSSFIGQDVLIEDQPLAEMQSNGTFSVEMSGTDANVIISGTLGHKKSAYYKQGDVVTIIGFISDVTLQEETLLIRLQPVDFNA